MFGNLKSALFMVLGFIALLGMAVLKGKSMEKIKNEKRDLEEYKRTRENMDEADIADDPDAARQWLRDRTERQRDL